MNFTITEVKVKLDVKGRCPETNKEVLKFLSDIISGSLNSDGKTGYA